MMMILSLGGMKVLVEEDVTEEDVMEENVMEEDGVKKMMTKISTKKGLLKEDGPVKKKILTLKKTLTLKKILTLKKTMLKLTKPIKNLMLRSLQLLSGLISLTTKKLQLQQP